MFVRSLLAPTRLHARVGQEAALGTRTPSCGIESPFLRRPDRDGQGRRSVAGIDSEPASAANAPQGRTNTIALAAAGTPFAISFTPYCAMTTSRIFLPPDVATAVVISAIEIAGQNFLLGAGSVPGDLFGDVGSDFCCSLIESRICESDNPLILRGNTKSAIPGALVLRGAVIGSEATDCISG